MRLHYRIPHILLPLLFRLFYRVRYYDRHLVPKDGGALLACNHQSNLDPPVAGMATPREISYMAKRELFKNPLFGALIRSYNAIPVDRGRAGRDLFKRLIRLVKGGRMLLMFPEGTRSRTGELLPAQAGIGMMARMAGAPVVPAYIHGTRTARPSLLNKDEISVTFGEPITAADQEKYPGGKAGYQALSDEIMARIARLKAEREKESRKNAPGA